MRKKIGILVLSPNSCSDGRILLDEEAGEIFKRLQEGPYRHRFQLHIQAFTSASDLQKLLLMHEPHIVHFSGYGNSQRRRFILRGSNRRRVDQRGLVNLFALYNTHVRLVLLNAWFNKTQAQSVSEVINYSVGMDKGISDQVSVTFAGAFYRALGFGKSVSAAFKSAKAELALTEMLPPGGIDLFVRNGVSERDRFPGSARLAFRRNPVRRRRLSQLSRIG